MSELLDRIKEVQAQVHCSTLEAKQLLEEADDDVDVAVAIYRDNHPASAPVAPRPVNNNVQYTRNNNDDNDDEDERPRRRRRLGWIPVVAIFGFIVSVGAIVGLVYLSTNGFSTSGFNFLPKTSSAVKYKKPSLDELSAFLSDKIAASGQFDPIQDGGTAYTEVDAESYSKAKYNFSTSSGDWYLKIENVKVRPKGYSIKIIGDLIGTGYVTSSGSKVIDSLEVSGYTIV